MFPSFFAWLSGSALAIRLAIIVAVLALAVALGFAVHALAAPELPRTAVALPLQAAPLVMTPLVHVLLARP
jgi:hypothetical protein